MKKKRGKLIVIDGPMGSGKTTVSKLLQERIKEKTALVCLDKLKRMVSQNKLDNIIHLELAHEVGALMANFYLKKGVNVIVEKAFTKSEFLESFLKLIKGKPKIFIYQIEAPFEIRIKRVKEREKNKSRGIPKNKLGEKMTRNTAHYDELKYQKARTFDTSKLGIRKITNEILKDVEKSGFKEGDELKAEAKKGEIKLRENRV